MNGFKPFQVLATKQLLIYFQKSGAFPITIIHANSLNLRDWHYGKILLDSTKVKNGFQNEAGVNYGRSSFGLWFRWSGTMKHFVSYTSITQQDRPIHCARSSRSSFYVASYWRYYTQSVRNTWHLTHSKWWGIFPNLKESLRYIPSDCLDKMDDTEKPALFSPYDHWVPIGASPASALWLDRTKECRRVWRQETWEGTSS